MAFTSVAQKRKWITENYSDRIAQSQGLADFNRDGKKDLGDVTVRSETILTLQDTNNDGMFDASKIFADDFKDVLTGVAHSVTPIGDSVYATIIPDLWKLTDTNGDGTADRREKLVHGFANHIGYGNHDLHSVVHGYDGKIYWSMGDRGVDVVSKEGKHVSYPHTGSILRCNPDGTDFEVFASGLRNCQYFDFDNFGNLFSIDHDADFQGERERLVYISEGSDSGWRCYYQYRGRTPHYRATTTDLYSPWLAEKMWIPFHDGQPSHHLPPIENSWNAPAAFSFQPGTALGGKYKDHFLLGGLGAIRAFKMVPDGATFKRQGEDEVVQGLGQQVLTSTIAPNGGLYFTIWQPRNGLASLWVLRDRDQDSAAAAVEALLSKGVGQKETPDLLALLDHEDRRVRFAAQQELVSRKDVASLHPLAGDEEAKIFPRLHALWALGQLKYKNKEFLAALCRSSDPEMRAQVARWAGDLHFDPDNVVPTLLKDTSPRVQLFAAITCGKLRSPGAVTSLADLLVAADNKVPVLRHAGVIGLAGVATRDELRAFSTHPSEAMRIAAVVALRKQKATTELMSFLGDKSEQVQADAVRAIYDVADAKTFEKHPEALNALAAMLDSQHSVAITIRALAANRRLGTPVAMKRIVALVTDQQQSQMLRVAGLDTLATWSSSTTLDPVDGRYFPLPAFKSETLQDGFAKEVSTVTNDKNAFVSKKAIIVFSMMTASDGSWNHAVSHVMNEQQDISVREEWFRWLQQHDSKRFVDVAIACLASKSTIIRQAAARELFELKQGVDETKEYLLRTLSESPDSREFQNAMKLLKGVPSPELVMRRLVKELIAGNVALPVQLDVIEAATAMSRTDEELRTLLETYSTKIKGQGALAEYRVALQGGNSRGGRAMFLNNSKLECSKCHALAKTDKQIGPSLQGIGSRQTAEYLLESLIDPQATIVPGYGILTLELDDGRIVKGTLTAETKATVTLKLTDGTVKTYPLSQIEVRSKLVGVMPDIKTLLNKRQVRDLVAYLVSLKQ